MTELEKIKFGFRFEKNEPNIWNYGVYRLGLTREEIKNYIRARANKMDVDDLLEKFNEIAGCNTMAGTPDGKCLMYRHDVIRYADVLFGKTDYTYFD